LFIDKVEILLVPRVTGV